MLKKWLSCLAVTDHTDLLSPSPQDPAESLAHSCLVNLIEFLTGQLRLGIERCPGTNVGSHRDGPYGKRKIDEPGAEASMQWPVPRTPQAPDPAGQITLERRAEAHLHPCHSPFFPLTVGRTFSCIPHSVYSPNLRFHLSSMLARSLHQTLETRDLGSEALASSQICVTLRCTQWESHFLLVLFHLPVCSSQEFRARPLSHWKPPPTLTALFLLYRVLFRT